MTFGKNIYNFKVSLSNFDKLFVILINWDGNLCETLMVDNFDREIFLMNIIRRVTEITREYLFSFIAFLSCNLILILSLEKRWTTFETLCFFIWSEVTVRFRRLRAFFRSKIFKTIKFRVLLFSYMEFELRVKVVVCLANYNALNRRSLFTRFFFS